MENLFNYYKKYHLFIPGIKVKIKLPKRVYDNNNCVYELSNDKLNGTEYIESTITYPSGQYHVMKFYLKDLISITNDKESRLVLDLGGQPSVRMNIFLKLVGPCGKCCTNRISQKKSIGKIGEYISFVTIKRNPLWIIKINVDLRSVNVPEVGFELDSFQWMGCLDICDEVHDIASNRISNLRIY